MEELDELLRRLAERCGKMTEATTPGAGAAGGLGFGMLAFFGATLRPGFDIVADATKLRDRLRGADFCLTGEGRLDASSLGGKAAVGVALICNELGVPCAVIAGQIADELDRELDGEETGANDRLFAVRYSLREAAQSLDDAIVRAPELIAAAAAKATRRLLQRGR